MKQVYKLIIEENNNKVLEEDQILEEILEYLTNISRRIDLLGIKLDQILEKNEIRF